MCGIAGFVNKNIKNKEEVIKKMADRIKYRGPDGEGYFIDDDVALAHRRLSIIDLSTGSQPMYNEDNSIVIVFNGEIYNFVELKDELKNNGHKFKNKSDTEVIIHGYEDTEGIVKVVCKIVGNSIIIEVSDTGKGIENIEEARKPLYTSKPNLERSGMGFTIMESFMDQVEVESVLGLGTKVTMKKKIKSHCENDEFAVASIRGDE